MHWGWVLPKTLPCEQQASAYTGFNLIGENLNITTAWSWSHAGIYDNYKTTEYLIKHVHLPQLWIVLGCLYHLVLQGGQECFINQQSKGNSILILSFDHNLQVQGNTKPKVYL